MDLYGLFLEKLAELANAENLLIDGLPKLVKAATDGELQTALGKHLKETEKQAVRIVDVFGSLRVKPERIACKPMVALVADGARAAAVRPVGVIRDLAILSAAQRVENFEIATYFSAISLAKTLGYGDAANLLVENLQEEQRAAEHLKKIGKALLKQAQSEACK